MVQLRESQKIKVVSDTRLFDKLHDEDVQLKRGEILEVLNVTDSDATLKWIESDDQSKVLLTFRAPMDQINRAFKSLQLELAESKLKDKFEELKKQVRSEKTVKDLVEIFNERPDEREDFFEDLLNVMKDVIKDKDFIISSKELKDERSPRDKIAGVTIDFQPVDNSIKFHWAAIHVFAGRDAGEFAGFFTTIDASIESTISGDSKNLQGSIEYDKPYSKKSILRQSREIFDELTYNLQSAIEIIR